MALTARPTSAARLKEELEVAKLRSDIRFAKFTKSSFIVQIVNTLGLMTLGGLVFLYVQRPQTEHLEINRQAAEKQHAAALVVSALALQNPQDKESMLNTIRVLYPQLEFLGPLARSQTTLTQVAAASPAPAPAPQPRPEVQQSPPAKPVEPPPVNAGSGDFALMQQRQSELAYLDARVKEAEQQCRKGNDDRSKLERTLVELAEAMEIEDGGSGGKPKSGRGPIYRSLYEQGIKVRRELDIIRPNAEKACFELTDITRRRDALIGELDSMVKNVLR